MASRFWVGGSGTWDASDTTHWAATSGGVGGQSVPSNLDTVTFDALSGAATITLGATGNCTTLTSSSALNTFTMGSNTLNLTATPAVTIWNWTGGTLNANTSTIAVTGASTATRTFTGGGLTYNNLTYNVAGASGQLSITNSNTFNTITVGSGRTIAFTAGTTTTVSGFSVTGTQNGYVRLPGSATNYISAPDSAALSITSDITVLCRVALDDWTPATAQGLVSKRVATGNQRSYYLSHGGAVIKYKNPSP